MTLNLTISHLVLNLSGLEINDPGHSKPCLGIATKADLEKLQQHIMSKIAEFAATMADHNTKIEAAVTDLTGDVASLNAKIEELQASQGELTPEDQALLDDIQASAGAVVTKLEALAAVTPPAVPEEPTE